MDGRHKGKAPDDMRSRGPRSSVADIKMDTFDHQDKEEITDAASTSGSTMTQQEVILNEPPKLQRALKARHVSKRLPRERKTHKCCYFDLIY